MNAQQLADHCGITYRQLDYWARRGWIKPTGQPNPGYGYSRSYTDAEIEVIKRMALLVRLGFQPASAAGYARNHADMIPAIYRLLNGGPT